MATVHKFTVPHIGTPFDIETHAGAEPLTAVACRDHGLVLYLRVSPDAPVVRRRFLATGTGQHCPPVGHAEYVGTAQMPDGLVWHVFAL